MFRNRLLPLLINTTRRSNTSFYDPPYLDSLKPKIPLHDLMNIQIKGYDFAQIECYQKTAAKIAHALDLDVSDAWALPGVQHKIQKYKPNSTVIENEYILTTYERNLQIEDLPANIAPIFIELLQASLPQGVSFIAIYHSQELETKKYVPDLELKDLKDLLTAIGGPSKKKKT